MTIPPELLPIIQITVPMVVALFGAAWLQNKRLDDIVGRLGAIENRLTAIEGRLASLEQRVTRLEDRVGHLEERIPPLVRH